ncbi:MAG: hypothetical protein L0Y72_02760 [Gemmataceae bacterium]|nr:hypothetical protein [Gemmataceae bacterium]MCI0737938.1 hypothetical protein [Gemmataceae bacterium]
MFRLSVCFALACTTPLAAQEFDVSRIDARVALWRPTAEERRFDDIGWAPDLCTALKAAKTHKRPVFLFTHDGHMQFGRC